MLMRADTAKNVVMGSKGAADIYQNGLNWQNGLQTFGGFFGARGNLKMMNGAVMGGRANRLFNAADEFLINNRTTRALGSGAGLAIGAAPRGVDKLWKFATGETLIGSGLHKMFDGTRYQSAMQKTADWLRLKACFAAGTKLLAKGPWGEGWREIERITTDDFVASRDENNPQGPIEWKAVEELFQRTAPVMSLTVNGQVIRTTAEHPFYHEERGWTPAGELAEGDRLVGQYGELVIVTQVASGGEFESVYNLRVADWHTYFVGDCGWGFGVWAHNADYGVSVSKKGVVQVYEKVGGKRVPVMDPTTAARLEVAVHEAVNAGKIKLADLNKLRDAIGADPALKGIGIRKSAQELDVIRPGMPEWDDDVAALQNPTKRHGTDFRVESYRDAEALLQRGNPDMPFFEKGKTAGWDTYRRGYESHGLEIEPGGSTPWNNLTHIKWRDMTPGRTTKADGHIYFGG